MNEEHQITITFNENHFDKWFSPDGMLLPIVIERIQRAFMDYQNGETDDDYRLGAPGFLITVKERDDLWIS